MTLRVKTVLVTLLLSGALFLSMQFLFSRIIFTGFLDLERDLLRRDVTRAQNAFNDEFAKLVAKSSDWALWDDAYFFAENRNQEFIESNLSTSTIANMGLDFLIFYDLKGEYIYGAETLADGGQAEPNEELRILAEARPKLFADAHATPVTAGLRFQRGFGLVVVRPLHRSDGSGAPAGLLLFGRLVSPAFVENLADLAQLELSLSLLPSASDSSMLSIATSGETVVSILDATTIEGATVIKDLDGKPALILRVKEPRRIVAQGLITKNSVLLTLLVAGGIFTLTALLILERSLLRRLLRMTSQVKGIAQNRSAKHAIEDQGSDEIGVLAAEMNGMLTALDLAEQETVAARHAAEAAAAAKAMFLANMSHELRTPINGIVGMAQVMLNVEKNLSRRESLGIIKSSGLALLDLINQLLDQAKVEQGKMKLEAAPLRLRQLCLEALKPLAIKSHEKRLVLRLQVSALVPDAVIGDALRLRQILVNLVGNAIKFTSHGSVELLVDCGERSDDGVDVSFVVADTGIGIPTNKLGAIFEPFTQADSSTSRRFGGTGLGLSITQNLVALMGGTIAAASDLGQGTEFTVTVPFPIDRAAASCYEAMVMEILPLLESDFVEAEPIISSPRKALRVLVADDTQVNQTVAKSLLEQLGHQVTVVSNGAVALATLETAGQFLPASSADAAPFDIVLMDVQMPELDGISVTQLIRERESRQGQQRLPIVAFSANIMDSEVNSYASVGMDGCLRKPIDHRSLVATLERFFPSTTAVLPPERLASAMGQGAQENVAKVTAGEKGVINLPILFERFADDMEIVNDVLVSFIGEVGDLIEALREARKKHEAVAIAAAAHALKGSCGNISAERCAELCGRVEHFANAVNIGAAEELLTEIDRELERVTAVARAIVV